MNSPQLSNAKISDDEAAFELLRRRQAREKLMDFILYTKPDYDRNWHHDILTSKLDSVVRSIENGEPRRVIVRQPPQAGKSEIISRRFPPFVFGKHPEWNIIATAYNDTWAEGLGRDARNILDSDRYGKIFSRTQLSQDSRARGLWHTSSGGQYLAAGVGGGITGNPAHILIIDDPYKDRQEAYSVATRKHVFEWWRTSARTRVRFNGAVILLMTSWHEEGLDNALIKMAKDTGEEWEIVDIPAMSEAGYKGIHPLDPRKFTGEGVSFWEKNFPTESLKKTKKVSGPENWSAMYQQKASPAAGNIIKRPWVKLWQKLPTDFDEILISWDLAFKKEEQSSRVAGQKWGRVGSRMYFMDRHTELMEFSESVDNFLKMLKADKRIGPRLVEDKANGPALESVLGKKIPGLIMVPVQVDKAERLRAVSFLFRAGNVFYPDPEVHPWAEECIEELVKMPNSAYNDDTDATTQALAYWNETCNFADEAENWDSWEW